MVEQSEANDRTPVKDGSPASWADSAKGSGEDDLNRAKFAQMVAGRLNRCAPGQDSSVFGLVGPWGSGKTTLLDMVTVRLEADWKVGSFSPWSAPDSRGLTMEFLKALESTLDDSPKDEAAKAAVRKYSSIVTSGLLAVPLAGQALKGIFDGVVNVATTEDPWYSDFEKTASKLKDLGHRVLIVADDIDRLDADELMTLLKVIRLLGRFPNVHYLIAYDQSTVEDLLSSQGVVGRSSAFMDKIVQYPFEIPPMARADRRRRMTATIQMALAATKWDAADQQVTTRASELLGILTEAVETPRTDAKFHEQISTYLEAVDPNELDVLDLVALTFLRLFHHDLWSLLPRWRNDLMDGRRPTGLAATAEITEEEWKALISTAVHRGDPAVVIKLVSFLFPSVSHDGLTYHVAHPLGFASAEYFERYLVLDVPEDDVRDQLVRDAITDLLAGSSESDAIGELTKVLDGTDTARSGLAYEKGLGQRKTSESSSPELIQYLAHRKAAFTRDSDFASGSAVLRRWLPREVFWGLNSSTVSHAWIISNFSDDALLNTLLLMGRLGISNAALSEVRSPFASHLVAQIQSDFRVVIEVEGRLNLLVTTAIEIAGKRTVAGILDPLIGDDFDLYLKVANEFVRVRNWEGSPDDEARELVFDANGFVAVVSPAKRGEFTVGLLGLSIDRSVSVYDTSERNRREFVIANLLDLVPTEDGGRLANT